MNQRIQNYLKRREAYPKRRKGPKHLEPGIDRRSFLTGLTLVAGGVLAPPLIQQAKAETVPSQGTAPAGSEAATLPDFRFPLIKQPARELPGGSAREATAREFPVSKSIAGVLMTL
ncbi:MAG: twin-arginine translocation signal domain-containing protein, partial [Thermodesulfobacteriota bacterium]